MSNHDRQPRLEAPYFGDEGGIYARMAHVLDYTARRHCPGWAVNVRRIEPEPVPGTQREYKFVANTQKLDDWCRVIREAPIGDRICLIDGDVFFVNGIDDVWDRDFDIAYTVRPEYIIPINGGVVFVRVTPETRAFMERWRQVNAAMYGDEVFHMEWKVKYGGLNQASFGCLLETWDHGLNLLTLPCTEWNCEDSAWGEFDPAFTRILHVKSGLRRLIFDGDVGPPQEPWWTNEDLMPLARYWLALEEEATQAEEDAAAGASGPGRVPLHPDLFLPSRGYRTDTIAAPAGAPQAEEVLA